LRLFFLARVLGFLFGSKKNPCFITPTVLALKSRESNLTKKTILSPEATPILETTPSRFFAQKKRFFSFLIGIAIKSPLDILIFKRILHQIPLEEIQSRFSEKKIKLFLFFL